MTTSSSTRKTVLVAADSPSVRERFKSALDSAGHRALTDFDDLHLIILDLRMPHASGTDLVKRIRKLDVGTSTEYTTGEHILPSIAPHLGHQAII